MNLIAMAYENYKKNKRMYKLCIVSIIISISMIAFFQCTYKAFNVIIQNELKNEYNKKELVIEQFDYSFRNKNWKRYTEEDVQKLLNRSGVESVVLSYTSNTYIDECYIGKYNIMNPDYLIGRNVRYNTFTKARIQAEQMKNKKFKYIVAGRDFKKTDTMSILLDENSVIGLGCSNYNELIGNKMTFKIGNNKIQVKVIGIYSKKLSNNAEEEPGSIFKDDEGRYDINLESAFLSSDAIEKINALPVNKLIEGLPDLDHVKISTVDIESLLHLYEYLSNSMDNAITCDVQQMYKLRDYVNLYSNCFIVLGFILFFIAIYNLYGIMLLVLEKRKHWFALQNILGFTKMDIVKCFIFELFIVGIKGYLIALFLVAVVCKIVNAICMDIYVNIVDISPNLFSIPFDISGLMLLVLIMLILLMGKVAERNVKKIDAIDILKKVS